MSVEDLVQAWHELEEHCPGYRLAREQYEGEVGEVFHSTHIRKLIEATGQDYQFRLITTPVDALADRVIIKSVTGSNDSVSQLLADVWEANDLKVWMPHTLKQTFMYGDTYLSVWPVDPEDPDADEATKAVGVEVVYHDPENTRIIYDDQTQRRKQLVITRWRNGKDSWRANLVYPDRIERWVSNTKAPSQPSDWTEFLDEGEQLTSWAQETDLGEINFFHFRTALPYGVPEHEAGYGCQNAITKMLVTQINVADSAGWPERYKLTDSGAELDTAGDTPDWDDDADAHSTDLTGARPAGVSSSLRSGPGTIHTFNGVKSVGEFAAAQPGTFLDPAHFYIKLMATLTKTPLYAFDPSGDMPSGESLKTADAPLTRKANNRVLLLTGPQVELHEYILRLKGLKSETINVQWMPTETAVGTDDWAVIQAKQDAGVPQDVTLTEAGYDPVRVQRWMSDQADVMDLQSRVELLNSIGDALTKLGTASGLGIIDDVTIQGILDKILPQAVPDTDPDPS